MIAKIQNISVQSQEGKIPFLDTLAQLVTRTEKIYSKRAKSKYITNGYLLSLIDLKSPLEHSYWNTFHCSNILLHDKDENKLTGKYCNNRWCLVCNRIRSAKLIKSYENEIELLSDLQFVTLTIPNVSNENLKSAIELMQKNFSRTIIKFKVRAKRKNQKGFQGLRKLECTYNFKKDNYHPHYHIVISGKQNAVDLVNDWLKRYPESNRGGQDIRVANKGSLRELFKYFTKVVSKTEKSYKNEYNVHIRALDNINQSFYGKRVFQGFGGIKSRSEEIEEIKSEELQELFEGGVFEWVQDVSDWVSEYGEQLTNNSYHKHIKVKSL
jgi:plasmid rolling circle replication initiator protein Rep